MPDPIETLQAEFDGYHQETVEANERLSAEVKELRDRVGAIVIPAAGRRSGIVAPAPKPDLEAEQRAAMVEYIRTGEVSPERRAVIVASDPAGGFAVPAGMDKQINDILISISPIRSVARVIEVSHVGEFEIPIGRRGAGSGWADELDTRTVTSTPALASVSPPGGEIWSLAEMSTFALEDMIFGADDWLVRNLTDEHAFQEGVAFISGSGVKRPLGFLSGAAPVTTGDASRPFGTLQYTPTGAAADFAATNPGDALINLVYSLAAPYRENAVWVMNSATAGAVRKLKNSVTGDYLWQQSIIPGTPDSLLGYRVVIAEDMPSIGAGNFAAAFGDFQRGYIIIDKRGSTLLRDPYSRKGFVQFFLTRRVHGAPTDSNAIKVLKVAAS